MKSTLLILTSLAALIVVVAIPAGRIAGDGHVTTQAAGGVLGSPASSGAPCRLEIAVGADTVYDRGSLCATRPLDVAAASYRYWEERSGVVLYVYDANQDLLCRVLDPKSVRVIDSVAQP